MDRIVIIGSPGAGKSTFAQALGDILDIEVLHLDRYFWESGWKEYSRKTRIVIQQQLVSGKERWIIEGAYLSSSDSRLRAADTIIFLDMPWFVCLWRVFKRHFISRNPSRSDIPDGCTDRLSMRHIAKIMVFPYRGRNLLRAKIAQIRADEVNTPEKKNILRYRSTKAVEAFLRDLSIHMQEEHSSQKSTSTKEFVPAPSSQQNVGLFNLLELQSQKKWLSLFDTQAMPVSPRSDR